MVRYPGGELIAEWRGHLGRITSAEARDGLVLTSSTDESARLWDATSGDQLAVLSGHEGPVFRATFDPSGPRMATAGGDGRALMWELPPSCRSSRSAGSRRVDHLTASPAMCCAGPCAIVVARPPRPVGELTGRSQNPAGYALACALLQSSA